MKDENATKLRNVFIIHFVFDALFLVNYFFLRNSENIIDEIILIIFIILSVALLVFMIRLNMRRKKRFSYLLELKFFLKNISEGNFDKKCKKNNDILITELISYTEKIKKLIFNATDFVKNIENRNLETAYKGIKKGEKNILAENLLSMRNHMKRIEKEENQRNWTTTGLAKFADILRENNDNEKKLHYQVISNLVKYTKSTQGGLFILNDKNPNDIFLELVSYYAYDRKKYADKKIYMGEGLVGQSFAEKSILHLRKVPENYVNVTSGLGKSNPKSILIIPLIVNEKVYGVIELASFGNYQEYQINFIDKAGQNIASSLANVKSIVKTQALLDELKLQAQEMRSKEEEMLQNMEELKATQEEGFRKEQESEELRIKLEKRNKTFKRNENVLRRAFEAQRKKEKVLQNKIKKMEESKMEKNEKMKKLEDYKKEQENQENELQFILDNLNVGVIWKDKNLNYLGANKYFLDKTSYNSTKEIIGKKDLELFPKEIAEKYMENDKLRIATNTPLLDFTETIVVKNNKILRTRKSHIPLRDEKNEVKGILTVFKNLTKKR